MFILGIGFLGYSKVSSNRYYEYLYCWSLLVLFIIKAPLAIAAKGAYSKVH
ncbi:hypothetical protein JCM18903_39 [Psychrobacter sp. JCM 18903]|nr:hypothetical protein JCM18903_39 [Psychrobacter sp. JCM 18903]